MSENETNFRSKFNNFFQSESTIKGLFITSITGISALISFSYAFASTRKRNASALDTVSSKVYDNGTQLALRALKWGTLYAFTGVGLICFGIWKVANVNNMQEFRQKMGSIFPSVPKNNPPQSRTEFASVTDLLQYLDDEYSTKKPAKLDQEKTDS
ncbi:transmembrane protein 242 [Planococcus citri]|uniref:transmembrane protein 242 n=1 Tax=Planococcus citri TaxID=170843 RepID=UPI0031F83654